MAGVAAVSNCPELGGKRKWLTSLKRSYTIWAMKRYCYIVNNIQYTERRVLPCELINRRERILFSVKMWEPGGVPHPARLNFKE